MWGWGLYKWYIIKIRYDSKLHLAKYSCWEFVILYQSIKFRSHITNWCNPLLKNWPAILHQVYSKEGAFKSSTSLLSSQNICNGWFQTYAKAITWALKWYLYTVQTHLPNTKSLTPCHIIYSTIHVARTEGTQGRDWWGLYPPTHPEKHSLHFRIHCNIEPKLGLWSMFSVILFLYL